MEIYVILLVCSVEVNDDDDDEIMNVLFLLVVDVWLEMCDCWIFIVFLRELGSWL